MAALDFPDNPAVGDVYGSSTTLWRWNGVAWASTAGASGERGRVAYAQIVASQGGITSAVADISGLAVTFMATAGRTYKVTAHAYVMAVTSGASGNLRIATGAGVQVQSTVIHLPVSGTPFKAHSEFITSALSGTTTLKVQCQQAGGSGAISVEANPGFPAFILVEDISYEAGGSGGGGSSGGAISPRGRVAYAQVVATQSGITSIANLNGLSVTWVADPARTYRTTMYGEPYNPGTYNSVYMAMIADSNSSTKSYAASTLPTPAGDRAIVILNETGLSGTVTRKGMLELRGGGGALSWNCDPANPSWIMVEDITYDSGGGAGGGVGAWTPVTTFFNGWANYSEVQQKVQYRKVGDMVQVRGQMRGANTQSPAFNLPVGFRPPMNFNHPLSNWNGTIPVPAFGVIDTDGYVTPYVTVPGDVSFFIQFSTAS